MSRWTHLMIHCSDTPASMNVTPDHIEQWHIKERGWSRVGYSIFIGLYNVWVMIPFDRDDVIDSWEISNGARGWNGRTKHICYAGGKGNKDTRNGFQFGALEATVKTILTLYPGIKVIGHNQVNAHKYCPSFNVPLWCQNIGVNDSNIDYNNYA